MKKQFLTVNNFMLLIICFFISTTISAETYTYDTAGRLTSVIFDDGTSAAYSYDANGNHISRSITLNNVAPTANNDNATTETDTTVAIDVVANDADSDGSIDATTVAIVTAVSNGSTSIDSVTGVISYTPTGGYIGADSLTYTVRDNEGATSNLATVSITVQAPPPNTAPVANNDSVTTNFDTAVVIDVLSNDSDNDGTIDVTTVVIVTAPASGNTTIDANGQITYTSNTGFSGNDSFTYTVNDNDAVTSNAATVSVTVNAAPPPPPPPSSGGSSGGGTFGFSLILLFVAVIGRRFLKIKR